MQIYTQMYISRMSLTDPCCRRPQRPDKGPSTVHSMGWSPATPSPNPDTNHPHVGGSPFHNGTHKLDNGWHFVHPYLLDNLNIIFKYWWNLRIIWISFILNRKSGVFARMLCYFGTRFVFMNNHSRKMSWTKLNDSNEKSWGFNWAPLEWKFILLYFTE